MIYFLTEMIIKHYDLYGSDAGGRKASYCGKSFTKVASYVLIPFGSLIHLQEIFVELYYRERVLTNILALLATATTAYYVLPLIVFECASANIPIVLVAIIAGVMLDVTSTFSRVLFNLVDRKLNDGIDSRFKNSTELNKGLSETISEMGLLGTTEDYQELVNQIRTNNT